ncbi:metallophosphoesterase family protein [Steroidobacter sp.]|uniref:metallophosphoesterase family protein n=1 Tax=Steroidobacter sp. TaxID=1978227 RepID=UPI001A4DCCCC|nr:metallophosphoesterase [Steroidobacter sp.]MBL8271127.1 metallophosphoesterase [Steroidobacter sp.]
MSVLLQISDPHFGTEQPPVVEALLRLARELQPAIVVVSGDITQRARRAQFDAAKDFVAKLPTKAVVVIPGNHDIPLFNVIARLFYPYAGFARVFGDEFEPEWQSDEFLVLGVNTTRPARHKDGEVSVEQIQRVSQRLAVATADQLRIVVTHQPVHVLRGSEIHNRLHGYKAAIDAWVEAGADIVMGGHIHLPYIAPLHEHYEELSRRCWVVQAGTSVSRRVRARHPNSVNVIERVAANLCRIERWDFTAERGEFSRVRVEELNLERSR